MTRQEVIDRLVRQDLKIYRNSRILLTHILTEGAIGYNNWDEELLFDELKDRLAICSEK